MTDSFKKSLSEHGIELTKRKIEILQVNVGKLCNMTCVHCHVEAGPTKTKENMDRVTAEAVVRAMDMLPLSTFDLTGGAPEMNPHFRYLVTEARKRDLRVLDRCNLTVFYERQMDDLPQFLMDHQVEIVASLPCYSKDNVDKQRGKGVFGRSIDALHWLNHLGYGKDETGLVLNLVYNPVGPHLPLPQNDLERDYKETLFKDFGIYFNRLFTITNMPITRYAKYLKAFKQYEAYVELLVNSFNISTVENLMCIDTLSVGWDGQIYDCDFNQMLGMSIRNGRPLSITNVTLKDLENWKIHIGNHCFGCTAGSGSSCQGALKQ